MKCQSNKELNKLLKKDGYSYRRRGKCRDCNGRCCNFVCFTNLGKEAEKYWTAHGTIKVKDKWIDKTYFIVPSGCRFNDSCGKCLVFGKKKMPQACVQFPANPFDSVYRYLMQVGKPCGFYFVDAKTGKKWNMRRKKRPKG